MLYPCSYPGCPKRAALDAATTEVLVGAEPEPVQIAPRLPTPHLTPQQLEVVRHIAAGLTGKEAARAMGIAAATAELHLRCARKRNNCLTTAGLVAMAVRAGLI